MNTVTCLHFTVCQNQICRFGFLLFSNCKLLAYEHSLHVTVCQNQIWRFGFLLIVTVCHNQSRFEFPLIVTICHCLLKSVKI